MPYHSTRLKMLQTWDKPPCKHINPGSFAGEEPVWLRCWNVQFGPDPAVPPGFGWGFRVSSGWAPKSHRTKSVVSAAPLLLLVALTQLIPELSALLCYACPLLPPEGEPRVSHELLRYQRQHASSIWISHLKHLSHLGNEPFNTNLKKNTIIAQTAFHC